MIWFCGFFVWFWFLLFGCFAFVFFVVFFFWGGGRCLLVGFVFLELKL